MFSASFNLVSSVKCSVPKDCEKIVHAFISSRQDYCNALLSGVSQVSLHKLSKSLPKWHLDIGPKSSFLFCSSIRFCLCFFVLFVCLFVLVVNFLLCLYLILV